ncbi:hypothetical protein [Chitinimonas naiadis]
MTFHEDIAGLKDRIGQAESEREAWRIAGVEERYLVETYRPMSLIAFLLSAFGTDSSDAESHHISIPNWGAATVPSAAFARHTHAKETRS